MDDKLDTLHRICVMHYRSGNSSHWKAMFVAYTLVGRYERGQVSGLASDMCLEDSTIYGWVDGVRAIRNLSARDDNHRLRFPDVRRLMRILRPSHFITVGELWRKLEFSDIDAYNYLKTCADNGISVRLLRAQIEREHGKPAPAWGAQLAKIENRLASLSVDTAIPKPARVLLNDIGRIAERAVVEERACIKRAWAVLHLLNAIDNDAESDDWLLAWAHGQADTLKKLLDEWGA